MIGVVWLAISVALRVIPSADSPLGHLAPGLLLWGLGLTTVAWFVESARLDAYLDRWGDRMQDSYLVRGFRRSPFSMTWAAFDERDCSDPTVRSHKLAIRTLVLLEVAGIALGLFVSVAGS